jgi:hypothetical protein
MQQELRILTQYANLFQESLNYFGPTLRPDTPETEAKITELEWDFESYVSLCEKRGKEPTALGFHSFVRWLDKFE